MDATIHERLTNARARLHAAVENGQVPAWLMQTAQKCLIDLDCALTDELSSSQARILLAQIDALLSVVGDPNQPRARRDANSR